MQLAEFQTKADVSDDSVNSNSPEQPRYTGAIQFSETVRKRSKTGSAGLYGMNRKGESTLRAKDVVSTNASRGYNKHEQVKPAEFNLDNASQPFVTNKEACISFDVRRLGI